MNTEIYRFIVVTKHDNGTTRFQVDTTDEKQAKQAVMSAEGCPECAIEKVLVTRPMKVVTVSQNTNSFGLYGHILMAKDGTAYQIAASMYSKQEKGTVLNAEFVNWRLDKIPGVSYEIPQKLMQAPADVIADVWK